MAHGKHNAPRVPAREQLDSRETQTEFPMRVSVCAWCRPKKGFEPVQPALSHGICLRHLRTLRIKGMAAQ